MSTLSGAATPSRFYVEIVDDIGYSEDYFDFAELPKPLREEIESSPEKARWTYGDGTGGAWVVTAQ